MNIDSFLIRLIILILPGLAGYKVYKSLLDAGMAKKKIKEWEDFLTIFLFSVISYLSLYGIVIIINLIGKCIFVGHLNIIVNTLNAFLDSDIKINYLEIFISLILGSIFGVVIAFISNKKIANRFFRKINVTNHFGDEDVWSYINNSSEIGWVIVRDHKFDLCYFGYIMLFSDSGEKRELLLGDVDVYRNSDGTPLYNTDRIYLCRDEYDLTIEITNTQTKLKNKKHEQAS
jgi:hypothetical protein